MLTWPPTTGQLSDMNVFYIRSADTSGPSSVERWVYTLSPPVWDNAGEGQCAFPCSTAYGFCPLGFPAVLVRKYDHKHGGGIAIGEMYFRLACWYSVTYAGEPPFDGNFL